MSIHHKGISTLGMQQIENEICLCLQGFAGEAQNTAAKPLQDLTPGHPWNRETVYSAVSLTMW